MQFRPIAETANSFSFHLFIHSNPEPGYTRGVAPYRFSLLAAKLGYPEIKTDNMNYSRSFLKRPIQLPNCSAAPWWPKNCKNMIFHSKIHYSW